jgi:hypothetical protein
VVVCVLEMSWADDVLVVGVGRERTWEKRVVVKRRVLFILGVKSVEAIEI